MQHAINSSGAAPFCAAGLYLVPIPPVKGKPSKAPRVKGWNKPKSQDNHHGYSNKTTDFKQCQGFNFGLYHGASQTLALDLDDLEVSIKVFLISKDLPPNAENLLKLNFSDKATMFA